MNLIQKAGRFPLRRVIVIALFRRGYSVGYGCEVKP